MKKTEYFSHHVKWNQYKTGIESVTKQRDNYINVNLIKIAKIENEELTTSLAGDNLILILKLTYYEK